MQKMFVEGLSNEVRFLNALKEVEHRGAPEAGWVLVEGDPGYGKTNQMVRHAIRNRCIMVRAKADWTPRWLLCDLADAMDVQRQPTTQKLMTAVLAELMERQTRNGFAVMVDEIQHCLRNIRVLETLRDLSDPSECVLIVGGNKGVQAALKSHKQILSRVDQFVEFSPATPGDVAKMCRALAPETKMADDLVAEIHRRSGGQLRKVMGAIARVEAYGRRNRGEIDAQAFRNRQLIPNESFPQLVASA